MKEKVFSLILAVPAICSEVSAVLVALGDTMLKQPQNPLKYIFFHSRKLIPFLLWIVYFAVLLYYYCMEGREFLNVEKITDQLDIAPNEIIADFGAGHGFFAIAFAKKVGSSGQVFAIDVLPTALESIRSQAKIEGLFNIKIIWSNLEKPNGSTLPAESCDMVMIANILFQVPDKLSLIDEAKRVLKENGRLVVIEWKPYITVGPKKESRMTEDDLKQLILSKGFSEFKTIDTGSHHYGFIFKK